jgi:RNA polymerase sigma-70 factor (ECF subfamily)
MMRTVFTELPAGSSPVRAGVVRDGAVRDSVAADPDIALMQRVQRDDPRAFGELVERHKPRLFARFFRSLQDRQEAEDLTQEVFLRLYRARKRYLPQARFTTWLYHIAQNVARNALRTRRRHARLRLNLDQADERLLEQANPAPPSRLLERTELAGVVRSAMSGLLARQRAALEMQQFQHRSYAEIALALDLTPKAAKSLLYRARNQLRGFLTSLAAD